jgi:non-heme chloroperoxidase
LTWLGDEHSDRLAGLVYLDAASDPADYPAASPEYMALYRKLPAAMRDHPGPSTSDRRSFEAYREWQARSGSVVFPESALRNTLTTNPDGSVGVYKASTPFIQEAFGNGALKRDYSRIRVPILAIFPAVSESPQYEPKNAQERAAIEAYEKATLTYVLRRKKELQKAPGGVRIVDLPGAKHHVFISNEADVIREIRAFLLGLH